MTVEVCPHCDIAGCHHIRERKAMTVPNLTAPEAVARMLDGVTPGPWRAQPHDDEDTAAMFWHVFGDGIILEVDQGEDGCVTTAVGSGANDRPARNARFIAWAREAVPALAARVAELEAWREDPESSDAWCAGNQFALDRLCHVLKVDPASVDWDGSDGSLTEEADSLIWRIVQEHTEAAEAQLAARDAENEKLREALTEAVEVVHKAYVAATMEAVNAGPSHPLKDNFDKWRVRCMNAETVARAALQGETT